MMKNIELNIKLKTRHMYEFQMRHSYLTATGIISLLVSLFAMVYLLSTFRSNNGTTNLLLIVASLMFTVIYPVQMLSRSFNIVKFSPVLSKPLKYTFTEEGILVSQDNDDALLPWENIVKVIETRNLIIVYSSPKNGYILPKSQYKEECEDIKTMIRKQVSEDTCKLELKGN